MEWISLASIDSTDVSPSCVKDFYSSMALTDGCLYVYVGGEERMLSKEDWGKFFGLPYSRRSGTMSGFNANEVWKYVTRGQNRSKSLDLVHDPVDRIILDFSSHSLYCRSQDFSTCEVYDLCCLWYTRNMKKVDITEIMFKRMAEISRDESKNVPYSNLITVFCKEKGWWCKTYQKDLLGVNSQPITPEALFHMSFVVKDGKLVKKVTEPGPSVPPPQNAPLSGLESLDSIQLSIQSLQSQSSFGSPMGGQAGHMTGGFMGSSTSDFMCASSTGFMGTSFSSFMGASSFGFNGSGGNQINWFNFQSPFPTTPSFTGPGFGNFMNSQPPQQQHQLNHDSQQQ